MRCGCWEALQNRSVHHLRSSQGHCGPLSTESISKYLPQLGLVPGCQGANREQKGSQGYSMNPALRSCSSVPSPAPFLGEQLTDIARSFGFCFVSPWCLHVLCGPRDAAQGLRASEAPLPAVCLYVGAHTANLSAASGSQWPSLVPATQGSEL